MTNANTLYKPLKTVVFLPYWVERQIQRGALSQQPLTDPQVLQSISKEDLLAIHALSDLMSKAMGLVCFQNCDYDAHPHLLGTAGWDASIDYDMSDAYYANVVTMLRSKLLSDDSPRVKAQLPLVQKLGEEFDGYTLRLGGDERIYVTIWPGYFTPTQDGADRNMRLIAKLLETHLSYAPHSQVARSALFETYYAHL